MKKQIILMLTLVGVLLLAACGSSEDSAVEGSENWPSDNVEFIVPYAEGGSADVMARGLASHWQELVDHNMIVKNSPGGAGALGAMQFLALPQDGQAFLLGSQPALSVSELVHDADFSIEDFAFINIEQRDYASITVPKNSPYTNIDELIEDVRNRPGEVTMSVTAGAGHSLFAYAFVDALDLDVNIITFSSGGEQRTDIIGGHSDFAVSGAHGDLAIQSEIEVLAVASEDEFPGWEGVPPVNEALASYDIEPLPAVGDNRYIGVHREFVDENPELFNTIVESYKENFESETYQNYIEEIGAAPLTEYYGPEESFEIVMELHELVKKYEEVLRGAE